MSLIMCKNAALGYEGSAVVGELNFSVVKGDYLCIVGENGSGKSTLIKGLLGLKKPLEGEITTGDGLKPFEIGYLPQQTAAQKDFPASAYEVVLSGRLGAKGIKPFYSKTDKLAADENFERFGIEKLKKCCYRDLSGGQQQRVLLARALCSTSKLLLLDEPTAGLDPTATRELYKIIGDLNKSGLTIIMVSHDIGAAIAYANRILHLKNDQVFFGKTDEYLASDVGKIFSGGDVKC